MDANLIRARKRPRGNAAAADRVSIEQIGGDPFLGRLEQDVRDGLTHRPKTLPPKYFYDERGCELFDQICDLPEYYLTRTERALLAEVAPEIIASLRPRTLVELAAGSADKTTILLDAMSRTGRLKRFVSVDISAESVRQSAARLTSKYDGLRVHGVVGDLHDRRVIEAACGHGPGPRLVAFLGSTMGNFTPFEAGAFLHRVGCYLRPADRFLLGVDLVKSEDVLNAAYNDQAGVTAEFNRNILRVINRHLDGDFRPEDFQHRARFNSAKSRMEIHLVARRAHRVRLGKLNLDVSFDQGESIRTEISCKYTREVVESLLRSAGLQIVSWHTDPDEQFALCLSQSG